MKSLNLNIFADAHAVVLIFDINDNMSVNVGIRPCVTRLLELLLRGMNGKYFELYRYFYDLY